MAKRKYPKHSLPDNSLGHKRASAMKRKTISRRLRKVKKRVVNGQPKYEMGPYMKHEFQKRALAEERKKAEEEAAAAEAEAEETEDEQG